MHWHVAGMVAALGFALLALWLHVAPTSLHALDLRVSALWQADSFPAVASFLAITALGGGVGIIGAAIAFAFLARIPVADVFRLSVLLVAAAFLNKVFKEFFARTRPEPLEWFERLPSFSFPSAHATAACALYGFVAVILYRRTRSAFVALMPISVILLIGASRVALGVHHASDVIGGYLLGTTLLALAIVLPFERLVRAT